MASNLAPAELFNKSYGTIRIDVFIHKYENERVFKLTDNSEIKLVLNNKNNKQLIELIKKVREAMVNGNGTALANAIGNFKSTQLKLKFIGKRFRTNTPEKEHQFSLSNFTKTGEFKGGQGKSGTIAAINIVGPNYKIGSVIIKTPTSYQVHEIHEKTFIENFNKQIPENASVHVKIKGVPFENIKGAVKVPGDVKADIALINDEGVAVCFISHKKSETVTGTSSAAGFLSYGGVTDIRDNETVQYFANKVEEKLKENNSKKSFWMDIDDKLQKQGIYGKDFGSPTKGIQNIDFIMFGIPTFTTKKQNENLTIVLSGDIYSSGVIPLKSPLKPVLLTRADSSNRHFTWGQNKKIENIRFSISPYGAVGTGEKIT